MDTGPHVHLDLGMVRIGVLFLGERLNVSLAGLVNVVDDPGLALFARSRNPSTLANRHALLLDPIGFMSHAMSRLLRLSSSGKGRSAQRGRGVGCRGWTGTL